MGTVPSLKGLDSLFYPTQGLRPGLLLFRPPGWLGYHCFALQAGLSALVQPY